MKGTYDTMGTKQDLKTDTPSEMERDSSSKGTFDILGTEAKLKETPAESAVNRQGDYPLDTFATKASIDRTPRHGRSDTQSNMSKRTGSGDK